MKRSGYMNSGQKEKHWETQKDFKIRYLLVLKNPLEQYKALEIKENGKTTRRYSLNFFN